MVFKSSQKKQKACKVVTIRKLIVSKATMPGPVAGRRKMGCELILAEAGLQVQGFYDFLLLVCVITPYYFHGFKNFIYCIFHSWEFCLVLFFFFFFKSAWLFFVIPFLGLCFVYLNILHVIIFSSVSDNSIIPEPYLCVSAGFTYVVLYSYICDFFF